MADLREWYTQEELDALGIKKYPANRKDMLCDTKYSARFSDLKAQAKELDKPKIHRWSPKEDAFLRATHAFISNKVIALALNVPYSTVQRRLDVLKLVKPVKLDLEVIVWAERNNFERDMQREVLTKARPEVIL
jgi:hypothetical protein